MMYWVWYVMSIAIIWGAQLRSRRKNRKGLCLMVLTVLIRERENDVSCRNELRVHSHTFGIISEMVRDMGGLSGTRNMSLRETVALSLYTLSLLQYPMILKMRGGNRSRY